MPGEEFEVVDLRVGRPPSEFEGHGHPGVEDDGLEEFPVTWADERRAIIVDKWCNDF